MLLTVAPIAAACGKGEEPPAPTSGSPTTSIDIAPRPAKPGGGPGAAGAIDDRARAMFATVCATCHGIEGRGNGPAAENLNPKPRDYTDAAWQASVTDDALEQMILQGGQKLGKSLMMPGNPQLAKQPEVLHGLVQIIRGFGAKR